MLDVVCVGELVWDLCAPAGTSLENAASFRRAPGGAAANVAIVLARRGLFVGVCAGLGDDAMGRGLRDRLAEKGVDVRHVRLVAPRTGLVFLAHAPDRRLSTATVRPTNRSNFPQVVSYRHVEDEAAALGKAIPERLQTRLLHVGSLIPSTAMVRLLSFTMRRARQQGCLVTLDINARPRLWAGGTLARCRPVLAEADIVKCSARDLRVMGLDTEGKGIAAYVRPSATLLITHGAGATQAIGPFGQTTRQPRHAEKPCTTGAGDAFCAGVIAALAARACSEPLDGRFWHETLGEGHRQAGRWMRSAR